MTTPILSTTLGWILVLNNELTRGSALLERLAERYPHEAEMVAHYALTLAYSGDVSAAQGLLEKLPESDLPSSLDQEIARVLELGRI